MPKKTAIESAPAAGAAPVVGAAPAAPVTAPVRAWGAFPSRYDRALVVIESACVGRDYNGIANAFESFATLRPVRVTLPADASRDEKLACRDNFKADERLHQRGLRAAFAIANANGATVSERFAGTVAASGNVTLRHTVSAKLAAPKRATVKL